MTDMKQAEKCLSRWPRGLPWDRIVKSTKEGESLMRDVKHVTDMCAALAVICEKQEVELDAFKANGAASMETHTTEET